MMRRSPLKQRKTPMRQVGFSRAASKTPSAGAGLLRVAAVQAKASFPPSRESKPPKLARPMKSRGMKGRPPTADEARFMDAIAKLGCVACRMDGWENLEVSVHHIDGRTKPGAHYLVLPLCAGHHQAGTGTNPTLVAVHPDKARFEAQYGLQLELQVECSRLIAQNEKDIEHG
jgi:hypothetical protein